MKISDIVLTNTDAVYQPTQKSLSALTGSVVKINNEYDIHVLLFIDKKQSIIQFSKSELIIQQ